MKTFKFFSLFFFVLNSLLLSAQVDKVKYLFSYNNDSSYYDAYIVIEEGTATNADDRIQFNAQYSLVVDHGTEISMVRTYMPLNGNELYDGVVPMNWILNSDYQEYPASNPQSRFYSVYSDLSTDSRYNDLNKGDTVKIFSIKVDAFLTCSEVKLWDNTLDPQSSDPDMEGRDFNQGVTIGSQIQLYDGNLVGQISTKTTMVDLSTPTSIHLDINHSDQCKAPYTYQWIGPNGYSSSDKSILISNPQTSENGLYCCYVTDVNERIDTFCTIVCLSGCNVVNQTTFCSPGSLILNTFNFQGGAWQAALSNPTATELTYLANGNHSVGFIKGAIGLHKFYNIEAGIINVIEVNVTKTPDVSFTGEDTICVQGTTPVSPNTGVSWVSQNPIVAAVTNSGLVSGLSPGKAKLLATSSDGLCVSDSLLEVTVIPGSQVAYTGPRRFCEGSTSSVSPSTGGVWTSSNPIVASVSNAGIVTGLSQGTATLTYTSSNGCSTNLIPALIVDPKPIVSMGKNTICIGEETSLFSSTGFWTNHTPLILQVNSTLKTVKGLTNGIGKLTFKLATGGCPSDTLYVEVVSSPQITLQDTVICVGGTTFASPNSGGTWNVTNGNIATITNAGVITGLSPGYVNFIFTSSSGLCTSGQSETLLVSPIPIISMNGPSEICIGGTTTLSPTTGGKWVSSIPTVASVTDAGVVTGLINGTTVLSFTSDDGCSASFGLPIVVNDLPTVLITGPSELCIGGTTTLSPSTGGAWVSLDPSIASVNNVGIVTALSSGSVSFVFTSNVIGCKSEKINITVLSEPNIIIPIDEICIGDSIDLDPNGIWGSSDTAIVKIVNNSKAVGVNAGSVFFTFIDNVTSCSFSLTDPFKVNPTPITNLSSHEVCVGEPVNIAPFGGGTWTSTNQSLAIVNNQGQITTLGPGKVTFIYTRLATGCKSDPSDTLLVTPGPTVAVTGPTKICIGEITTLSPTTGGTWTSTNPAVATVTNNGIVSGLSNGTVQFVFTESGSQCTSSTETITVGNIDMDLVSYTICAGDTIDLIPAVGDWSSSDPNIVQILPGYKAVGISSGDALITVSLNNGNCTSSNWENLKVNPIPTTTLSTLEVCVGGIVIIAPFGGGAWKSSNNTIATINNSGQITTLAPGKVTFKYTKLATGCMSDPSDTLTIVEGINVAINGPSEICIGETTTVTPSSGGTWSSSNSSIATITDGGIVTGISNGTTKFTFIESINGCQSTTEVVTVGEGNILLNSYSGCIGDTIDLLPATGNWYSSDPNIIQILPGYKAVCLAEGLINLSVDFGPSSCGGVVTFEEFTVHPIPTTTLLTLEVCLGRLVSIAPFGGGTWQSSNNTIATINNQGLITTLAPGKVTFKYTKLATGCMSDQKDTLTIVAGPTVAITGPSQLCIGEITTLSPTSGGTWISSNTAVATVTNNGIVTAVSKGDANFVFTEVATFCVSNRTANISVGDFSLIKYDTLGLGNLIALDTLIPGAWTSSDTSVVKILDNHTAIGMKQGDALLYFKDGTNTACGDKKIFVHVVAKSTKVIGYTFRDVNNNEIYDLNIDTPLPNFPVTNLTLGNTIYSDQNGFFEIRIEQDEQLIIDAPYGKWDSIQVNRLVKFESSNNDIVFVGFYPTPLVTEGMVNLSSASLRCNSNVKFNASIFNAGNELLSGKLVVDISNKTSFVSAIPQPTSKVGSVLTWDFQNLKPGFNFAPDIRIYVPNPGLVGPKLSFDGYLIGVNNDTLSHKFFEDDILCSYDPNDKRSWPDREGEENLTLRTEHIDYMVRFQNTGNAEAFKVELIDILPKGLDKMSMMILENSHAMETQMIGDTLKFIFNDINLPDSMSNPEGSQGYVLFSFKSEEGIAENTVLSNTASIFFDENAPIVTNTVINTIVTSILCHEDTTNIAICPGESFSTANNDYTTEGMFSERTYGADGCDTLNHYRISFSEVPSDSIWFDSGIMYVDGVGTSYDWYECEKDSLLYTTILPNAEIMTSGIYGAVIHGVECDVETECVVVVINGLNDLLLDEIKVYPNPASDKLIVRSPYNIESIIIWNVYGQKMDVIINENTLDLNSFPNGAYFARISTKIGDKLVKFMVL